MNFNRKCFHLYKMCICSTQTSSFLNLNRKCFHFYLMSVHFTQLNSLKGFSCRYVYVYIQSGPNSVSRLKCSVSSSAMLLFYLTNWKGSALTNYHLCIYMCDNLIFI